MLISIYAITGFLGGGSFWQRAMLPTIGATALESVLPKIFYNLSFSQWYLVSGCAVLVPNTTESAMNVIRARRARGDRSRGALKGLLPFFGTWILMVAYLALQPHVLYSHLLPFALFAGFVNAYSVGQMITAHLVQLPFPYWNVMVVPLAWGVFDALGPYLQTHIGIGWPSALGFGVYTVAYVFLMLGLAAGVYGSFVVDVIVTICDYLDIWCLTIKHPYVEEEEDKKAQ